MAQSLKRPLASAVVAAQTKRPSIIQGGSAPAAASKMASHKVLSFTVDPNKTGEQLSVLRSSYTQCPFPEEDEVGLCWYSERRGVFRPSSSSVCQIYRLIESTGLSRGEIKKWFSEQRLLNLKGRLFKVTRCDHVLIVTVSPRRPSTSHPGQSRGSAHPEGRSGKESGPQPVSSAGEGEGEVSRAAEGPGGELPEEQLADASWFRYKLSSSEKLILFLKSRIRDVKPVGPLGVCRSSTVI